MEGQEIIDVEQWVTSAVKAKAMECKKQLIVKEQEKDQSFVEEIVNLAGSKVTAKDKNIKAGQLAKAYEDQLELQTKQQSLADD